MEEENNQLNCSVPQSNRENINDLIEKIGFGPQQWKSIFLVSLLISIEGLELTMMSSMIIPLKSFFQINEFEIKIVSSIIFIGVAVGSYLIPAFTNLIGRINTINLHMVLLCFFHLICALTNDFISFTISRFIIGINVGVCVPLSLNVLCEFLPVKLRALVLTAVWFTYALGQSYLLLIMYSTMPDFEVTEVKNVLLLAWVLPLSTTIFTYFYFSDSPRNLILNKQEVKGLKQYEEMFSNVGIQLKGDQKQAIVKMVKSGENKEVEPSVSYIFQRKYLRLSVLLTFIWILCSINFYGPMIIFTLMMKALNDSPVQENVILSGILMSIGGGIGSVVGGVFCEIPTLGRIWTMLLFAFVSCIFVVLSIGSYSLFDVWMAWYFLCNSVYFNVIGTYTIEAYPTKIRDTSTGFFYFCTRVGGFISQFLFLGLFQIGKFAPLYSLLLLNLVTLIMIYFLPFETAGRALDSEMINDRGGGFEDDIKLNNAKVDPEDENKRLSSSASKDKLT